MITFKHTGNFKKSYKFFETMKEAFGIGDLDKYGKIGVDALKKSTPVDTGKTAGSWDYTISRDRNGATLSWTNSNVNDGVPIVILLQYGHATKSGYFVKGTDFINPTMKPVFDQIAKDAWKEVSNFE